MWNWNKLHFKQFAKFVEIALWTILENANAQLMVPACNLWECNTTSKIIPNSLIYNQLVFLTQLVVLRIWLIFQHATRGNIIQLAKKWTSHSFTTNSCFYYQLAISNSQLSISELLIHEVVSIYVHFNRKKCQ